MLSLNKCVTDYTIFDLETTGLSPDTDAVIEISALKVVNGEIIEEFSTLVNPEEHIPYSVSSITGIMDDMVKDAPTMDDAVKQFKSFIGDYVLLGHNIKRFDLKFIQRDAIRFLGKPFSNEYVDTLFLAQRYLPELKSHSLEALADHYGVSYEGAHRAIVDCRINKTIYDHLAMEIVQPSEAARAVKVCPRCGNILKRRNGMYGEFFGCAGYPDCKYTRDC